jgi:hypothetical protein
MNPKDVAKMKNVSLGTVYLLKNSTSFDDKPRTGRPKKYSDKYFIYYIEKYPYFSPHQRRDIWKKDGNSKAPSVSTIEKWDHEHRVTAHQQRFKHFLTDIEKEKRVEAAKIHFGKIKKRSVLFYDETSTSHQLETRRYYVEIMSTI